MSEKRTSAEPSIPNDEETNEDPDAVFQQVDDDKFGKFASFSDTTIQDIPTEILQCILVKAITMEVKNMKLAKCVWNEKADLVISRLRSVCSQWSSVLATDFFQITLQRALDGIAPWKIRMEILQESFVNYFVLKVDTLKDEILMYCRHQHLRRRTGTMSYSASIAIHDRNIVGKKKEVIKLPGLDSGSMAACNVSNCVYVLDINQKLHCTSILRIARDEEQKFNTQTWISDLRFPVYNGFLSVSDEGKLIIVLRKDLSEPTAVTIYLYDPIGLRQHEVKLSPAVLGFTLIHGCVINESNGNLVLTLVNRQSQVVLTEIDTGGFIQRHYKSSLQIWSVANFADTSGRFLIHDRDNRIELLDSEWNLLEFTGPQPDPRDCECMHSLHFNSERNELLAIGEAYDDNKHAHRILLRVLRFTEE